VPPAAATLAAATPGAATPGADPQAWPELLNDAGEPASTTDDDRDARLSAEQEGRS
jgi:hypothetical protein